MAKRALLIGCNYTATPQYLLNGCINDIMNVKNMLIDAYDYKSSNMTILRDDIAVGGSLLPTRENIIASLKQLVNLSPSLQEVWIHYSGHGTGVRDGNGDENDGRDECIVPCDFVGKGLIMDDELFMIIKDIKCRAIICFDCCNSGTGIDLQYTFNYSNGSYSMTTNNAKAIENNRNIFFFSGCRDDQTSADAYNGEIRMVVGAFTDSLLRCLRENGHSVDIMKVYSDICAYIIKSGHTQCPVFSSSSSTPSHKFERTNVVNKVNVITQVVTQYVQVPAPAPVPATTAKPAPAPATKPATVPVVIKPATPAKRTGGIKMSWV